MEKIEVLLKKDLSSSFDTPKKLNRSNKTIDQSVIDQIENKEFTCENIASLALNFPIFKYRTCITIHGLWPQLTVSRIGSYKNVIQNNNGSVEIRYSAIDTKKIYSVAEKLRAIKSNFRFQENSSERGFYWMLPIKTKEDLLLAQTKMKPIAEKLTSLKLYGHVSLYTARDFFTNYLVLALIPLALPANMVEPLTLELTGMNAIDLQTKLAEHAELERIENDRRKIENEIYAKDQKEKKEKLIERANEVRKAILHLNECNDITKGTLVKVYYDQTTDKLRFVYYRQIGKGSFGRIKYAKAFTDSYTEQLESLTWNEQKQKMQSEFNLKEFRLFQKTQLKNVA
jgi:hypothetical protein